VRNKCFLATSVEVVGPICFTSLAAFSGARTLGTRCQPKDEHMYDAHGDPTSPRVVSASSLDASALRRLLLRCMVQSGRCGWTSLDRRDVTSLLSHIFPYLQALVAGSEASTWSGRCQRIYMELSHEPDASHYSAFIYIDVHNI
jgi:hypothetical protein